MPDAHVATAADAAPQIEHASYPSWQALGWFTVFRLLLAAGLTLTFIPSPGAIWQTDGNLPLIVAVLLPYWILLLFAALFVYVRWPKKEHQVQAAVFVDIVVFTLIMYAAGGVGSGMGPLLTIAVAAGSLLMEGRLSLLFAALATLGVITQQLSAQLYSGSEANSITEAGLLGVTFFTVALLGHVLYRRIRETKAVALLGHVLYRRIRETEAVAARRQVDIADLSQLNEFIIQSMGTGVLVVDRNRQIMLMNAAANQLLGVSQSMRGRRLDEIALPLAQRLAATASLSSPNEGAVTVRGREIKTSFRLLGEDAEAGVLMFLRDNQELAREAQQIKLASLGRLTASIAHNIRNPLSSVSHAGQLLAESPALGKEDLRLLDIIRRNTHRIDEIIESVLQLSRRDRAEPRSIDLAAWLAEFCADYRETHTLSADRFGLVPAAEILPVETDPRHLHQIVSNLCDNALQHSSKGDEPARIEIHARHGSAHANALLEVADDGPGIPLNITRDIFSPFFTTSVSGTGLGLYIARELSEANGINLAYIAREKRGSCFRLTFPV